MQLHLTKLFPLLALFLPITHLTLASPLFGISDSDQITNTTGETVAPTNHTSTTNVNATTSYSRERLESRFDLLCKDLKSYLKNDDIAPEARKDAADNDLSQLGRACDSELKDVDSSDAAKSQGKTIVVNLPGFVLLTFFLGIAVLGNLFLFIWSWKGSRDLKAEIERLKEELEQSRKDVTEYAIPFGVALEDSRETGPTGVPENH
ncbi:hypothetical protein BJ508DRAFT_48205 [Ascobolus immersus RN42]|uniref:Uncharacterized protein n=1 Tax=Ascobolus immersus RN42 TaxID=1160509 RepID=A0A3N4HVB5_ASCIM|nr:hypothetical protein BJ508DRAFT_48205 [Ascobolus immersus RN42]